MPNIHQQAESSTSGPRPKKRFKRSRPGQDALPGTQKLKSALRQTRRLLGKEINPDVRIETERRLKALEADLSRSELAKKERSLAIRYHKVKFFERQKVVRKIHQTVRQLSSTKPNPDLENALFELRVDLNYILHYPKTKRYISLFPPEVRHDGGNTQPQLDTRREEVKDWIREQMNSGDLPTEPERCPANRTTVWSGGPCTHPKSRSERESAKTDHLTGGVRGQDVEADIFFGEDEEENSDADNSENE